MDKPYKCPVCPLAFTRSHHCRGHLTAVHKFYRCTVCSALFTSDEAYEAHKKVHPEECLPHDSGSQFLSNPLSSVNNFCEDPKNNIPVTKDIPQFEDKTKRLQDRNERSIKDTRSVQPAGDIAVLKKLVEDVKLKSTYSEFSDCVFTLCNDGRVDPELLRNFIDLNSRYQSKFNELVQHPSEQKDNSELVEKEKDEALSRMSRKRKFGVSVPSEDNDVNNVVTQVKERKTSTGSESSVQSCHRVSVIQYHGSNKQDTPTPSPASSYVPSARDSPTSSISYESPPTTPRLTLPSPSSGSGTSTSSCGEAALSSLSGSTYTALPNKTTRFSYDIPVFAPTPRVNTEAMREFDYCRSFPISNPSWTYHIGMDYRMMESGMYSATPSTNLGAYRHSLYQGFPDRYFKKEESGESDESLTHRRLSTSSGESSLEQVKGPKQQEKLDGSGNRMKRRDSSFNGRFIGIAPRPVSECIAGRKSLVCFLD